MKFGDGAELETDIILFSAGSVHVMSWHVKADWQSVSVAGS